MRYVSIMDRLWRLSERAYVQMLKSVADEDPVSLSELAGCKRLGELHNVTDLEAGEAADILADLRCEKRAAKARRSP